MYKLDDNRVAPRLSPIDRRGSCAGMYLHT